MRNRIVLLSAVILGPFVAGESVAQEVQEVAHDVAHGSHAPAPVTQHDLEWVEIIPGVDFAAVYGQWAEGAHAKFVRFAPGMAAPLHSHTNDYHGVVVQGQFTNPYPAEQVVVMGPGDYWHVPGGAAHSNECVSEEPCVFFTYGDASWDLEMIED